MASMSESLILACCACLAVASLPPTAASGSRKMLDKTTNINVAIAQAQAGAGAGTATATVQQPIYVSNDNKGDKGKHKDNKGKDKDKCHGNKDKNPHCNEPEVGGDSVQPYAPACQAAAQAYASGSAVSSGNGSAAFTTAKAVADAKAVSGSDDWLNTFSSACSAVASAEATSVAGSGK